MTNGPQTATNAKVKQAYGAMVGGTMRNSTLEQTIQTIIERSPSTFSVAAATFSAQK